MRYLLDTVAWLWSLDSVDRLNDRARAIVEDGRLEVYLSAVSSWELSIKMRQGKLRAPGPPDYCVFTFAKRQGLRLLAIAHSHTVKVFDLPDHHRDPFDRLLIAQAMVEKMTILTSDRNFEKYPVEMIWCGK